MAGILNKNIAIVTDSTVDIPKELIKKMILPLYQCIS